MPQPQSNIIPFPGNVDRKSEQQPARADAPSAQEQIKKIRAEIKVAEQRAIDVSARLAAMVEKSSNPRLLELKQQSDQLLGEIRRLNENMLNAMLGEESIEDVSKKAESIVKTSGNLFFEEQKQQAAQLEIEHRAEIQQARERIGDIRQEQPVEQAPKIEEAKPEMATIAPEAPSEALQPEPGLAAAEPIPAETSTEQPQYDRPAFWSELKQKLGDRSAAAETQKKNLERLQAVNTELQQLQRKIEAGNEKHETVEELIASITAMQTELGGAAYASEVQEKLLRWTSTPGKRKIFDDVVRDMLINPLKRTTGVEGVIRDLRVAKERAATAGSVESLLNKLGSILMETEVQTLERQRRLLETKIIQAIDTLVDRVQTENKLPSLQERQTVMKQAEETISIQVGFDTELFDQVNRGEQLYKQERQAYEKLKYFALRLQNKSASSMIAETLPTNLPEEARALMGVQEIQTYEALSNAHAQLVDQLNKHIDDTRSFMKGGIARHQRRMVSEALGGAKAAIDEDFGSKEAEPIQMSNRQATTKSERAERSPDETITEATPIVPSMRPKAEETSGSRSREREQQKLAYIAETNEALRKVLRERIPDQADNITYLMGVPFEDETEQGEIEKELGNYMVEPARRIIKKLFSSIDTIDYTKPAELLRARNQRRGLLQRLDIILRRTPTKMLPEDVTVETDHTEGTREEIHSEAIATIEQNKKERAFYDKMEAFVLAAESLNKKKTPAESSQLISGVETLKAALANKKSFDEMAEGEQKELERLMQAIDDKLNPIEAYLPPTAEEMEATAEKEKQLYKTMQELSDLYHRELGELSHSELLPKAGTWEALRRLDSAIKTNQPFAMMDEADRLRLAKTAIDVYNSFHEQVFSMTEALLNPDDASAKIKRIVDLLDLNTTQTFDVAHAAPLTERVKREKRKEPTRAEIAKRRQNNSKPKKATPKPSKKSAA